MARHGNGLRSYGICDSNQTKVFRISSQRWIAIGYLSRPRHWSFFSSRRYWTGTTKNFNCSHSTLLTSHSTRWNGNFWENIAPCWYFQSRFHRRRTGWKRFSPLVAWTPPNGSSCRPSQCIIHRPTMDWFCTITLSMFHSSRPRSKCCILEPSWTLT